MSPNKQKKTSSFDVEIIGGGPAGSATALSLNKHAPALSVALIEQSTYSEVRIGETLPPIVQTLLEQLGVWNPFLTEGHVEAYGNCSVWGSDQLFENEFISHPAGRGWHLDRSRFDAFLARESADKGVSLFQSTRFIASGMTRERRWRLRLQAKNSDEISIEAKFVVDATGRKAVFASEQRVRKVYMDQLLGACVFFSFRNGSPVTDNYTLVEAWPEGWWYSALLPDEKIAVVCMSDVDIVKKRRLKSSSEWLGLMNETRYTKVRMQEAEPLGAPTVYAASSRRLEKMFGDRWLAVGDAATTFDPLSSLGIFKGLRSGIMASYAIADYLNGDSSGLEKYQGILAAEFEEYLVTRAGYYGQERRWEESSFWRRRYDQITLSPKQVLRISEKGRETSEIEKLSMCLPVPDLKFLSQTCGVSRKAYEVVSEFKAQRRSVPDRRVILAIQYLIKKGIIQCLNF